MVTIERKLGKTGGFGEGFDFLRIVTAMTVILFHSFVVVGAIEKAETGFGWLAFYSTVPLFFALSGFLVTASGTRLSLKNFLLNRAIRVVPALAVETMISTLIIGPVFSECDLVTYLSDPKFAHYFTNIVGWIQYELPGVFLRNNSAGVVNVSLWSIQYELFCYAIVMVGLMLTGSLRIPARLATISGLYWVATIVLGVTHVETFGHPVVDKVVSVLFVSRGALPLLCFLTGAVAYAYRRHVPYSPMLFVCVVLLLATLTITGPRRGPLLNAIMAPTLTYVMVFIGTSRIPRLPVYGRGDYSYGVYLYGYPIQQSLAALFPEVRSPWLMFTMTAPVVTMIAIASWRFVEGPILRLRKRYSIAGRHAEVSR